MSVQASCGRPLVKRNRLSFRILLYILFIGAGPVAHFGRALFLSWLKAKMTAKIVLMRFVDLLQSTKADVLHSRTCLKTLQPQTRKTSTISSTLLTPFGK